MVEVGAAGASQLEQVKPGSLNIAVFDEASGESLAARLTLEGPSKQLVNVIDQATGLQPGSGVQS